MKKEICISFLTTLHSYRPHVYQSSNINLFQLGCGSFVQPLKSILNLEVKFSYCVTYYTI